MKIRFCKAEVRLSEGQHIKYLTDEVKKYFANLVIMDKTNA